MRLHALKIEGKKPNGWESAPLPFGLYITELFGPNGSGKTPIIQSVVHALGYPVKYRDDILAHCDAVALTLENSSKELIEILLLNGIHTGVDVEVRTVRGPGLCFLQRARLQSISL